MEMRDFITIVESAINGSGHGVFGPMFHGTTAHKMTKIASGGFKVPIGKSARNGFSSYSADLPLQTLGYGAYFALDRVSAASYSRKNGLKAADLPSFYLNSDCIMKVFLADQAAFVKWAVLNGYDFEYPDEAITIKKNQPIYANGLPFGKILRYADTKVINASHPSIYEARVRATENLTKTLASKCDAVWLCSEDGVEPFDHEQVCVYRPELIVRGD